ncbi:MAG TPA: aldehyde dehydrogenase family protein [Actinoplanes sp.]
MPGEPVTRDRLYIDGGWVAPTAGAPLTDVLDASDGSVLGRVARGGPGDVERAVAAARAAFHTWSQTRPEDRAGLLEAIRDVLAKRQDEIARLISLEVGTPTLISTRVQVGLPLQTLQGFADAARTHAWADEVGNSVVVREPAGVVGAITPWNYPLHQLVGKVGGALAAGCTVVAKPADEAPLSAFALADAIAEAGVPAGVVNLVSGHGPEAGAALAGHAGIDVLSFTGSTTVGAQVAALAAANITRVALELGGKSASVVLDDADLPRAVKTSVHNAFLNSGQTCSAWTRLVVPRNRHDEVLELARAAAVKLTVGHPLAEGTRLGPLATAAQQETVRRYIRLGVEEGATLVTGGPDQPADLPAGFYVQPTIFGNVDPSSRIAQEEIFGPVLVVIPHDGDDDAVTIANHSAYGLAGGVWSTDPDRAMRVARRIRTGQVDVNGGRFNPAAPFGGYKRSGIGREFGHPGIDEFTELKAIQRP